MSNRLGHHKLIPFFNNLGLDGKLILSVLGSVGVIALSYSFFSVSFTVKLLLFASISVLTYRLPVIYGRISITGPFLIACLLTNKFTLAELILLASIGELVLLFDVRNAEIGLPLNILFKFISASEGIISLTTAWVVFQHLQPSFSSVFSINGFLISMTTILIYILVNVVLVTLLVVRVHPRPKVTFVYNFKEIFSLSIAAKSNEYLFAIIFAGLYLELGRSILFVSLILFFLIGGLSKRSVENWMQKIELNQKLRENEAFLRDLFQSMDAGLVAVDQDYQIIAFNSAAKRILEPNLAKGMQFLTLPQGETLAELKPNTSQELVMHERIVRVRKTPIHSGASGYSGFLYLFEDITESKALEDYAMHKDRLSLLGQFSAGIMHEIGKPLTALSLAYEQLASSSQQESKPLRILGKSIDDLSELSQQLLTFSQPQPSRGHAVTSLHDTIINVIEIADILARKNRVSLRWKSEEEVFIDINEREIRQVLLNLLSNAIEVSSEGSVVIVRSGNGCYTDEEQPIWVRDYCNGRNITAWLYVEDSGPGFDSKIIEKLGNTYITTKTEGTGLGLAIVLLLVKRWNARIRIYCPSSGGSRIVIEF